MRRLALAGIAVSVSALAGVAVADWAIADANGYYMNPADAYRPPAYARAQPIADTFWQDQDGRSLAPDFQAAAVSTATSTQPEYFSASGS